MHILMLLDFNYPPDQRVENEAESLVEAGFEVTVLSIGKDERPQVEFKNNVRVKRINMPLWLRKKLRGAVGFFDIYSLILTYYVLKFYKENRFDVIHVHDLYLAKTGVIVKNKLKLPLLVDLHENYVQALTQYAWSTQFPGKWFVSIKRWSKLEMNWLQKANMIIVVIQEMKKRYLTLGFSEEKLITIPNTPNIKSFRSYPLKKEILSKFPGRKVLLYSGGFDLHRGLSTAIEAMNYVKKHHKDVLLVLVGDGRNRDELEELVRTEALSEYVIFEGWQDQSNIRSYVNRADIGLIPHVRSVQTDASIPHKLGYYMSEELPVITSNCTSLKRMVTEHNAGKVFESENPKDLANQIISLLNNEEEASEFAKNGKLAVEKEFNWQITVQPLIRYYQGLSKES